MLLLLPTPLVAVVAGVMVILDDNDAPLVDMFCALGPPMAVVDADTGNTVAVVEADGALAVAVVIANDTDGGVVVDAMVVAADDIEGDAVAAEGADVIVVADDLVVAVIVVVAIIIVVVAVAIVVGVVVVAEGIVRLAVAIVLLSLRSTSTSTSMYESALMASFST